ncbi:hypothetical protein CEXT_10621 [Caerostris extrusa]|uniref:Uncharacterized protein n=1 Tax=Caerostris extrusa TaxID=172846 RepID=A0AAV4P3T5_CAEEX|nr:hypothetical protein CEXT_10621 [Caerostris extrusa]
MRSKKGKLLVVNYSLGTLRNKNPTQKLFKIQKEVQEGGERREEKKNSKPPKRQAEDEVRWESILKCRYVPRKRATQLLVDFLPGSFFAIFFGIKVFRAMAMRISWQLANRTHQDLTKQMGFTWQCSPNGQGNGVYLRYWLQEEK